jgi:hypothetical protein
MAGYGYDRRGNRIRVEIASHTTGISHSDGRYSRGKITSRRTHLMPTFEMTAAEEQQYGNSLSIWQALRLLSAWQPLIAYGQRFLAEADPYRKSVIVAEGVEWVAGRTDSTVDDELAKLIGDILRTPQGEALVRWGVAKAEAIR